MLTKKETFQEKFSDRMDSINRQLHHFTGVTGEIALNQVQSIGFFQQCNESFFKPYKNVAEVGYRAATVAMALPSFVLLAIESLLIAIALTVKSVKDFIVCSSNSAYENSKGPCDYVLVYYKLMICALVSPAMNLVDFIGSGIATIYNGTDADIKADALNNTQDSAHVTC